MCVLVCVSHRILKSEHSLLIAGNGENVSRILAQPNDSLHIDSIRSFDFMGQRISSSIYCLST